MKKLFFFFMICTFLFADKQLLDSKGQVLINDKMVDSNTVVNLGDFIETNKNSTVRFNIGKDAFMAKENTKFQVIKKDGEKVLNVISGGVLAVFGNEDKHSVKTENMTAGIRGTGVYLEHKDGKSYFCTCYGHTHLDTKVSSKELKATHHNMVWVKEDGNIKPAEKMLNHSDDELRTLEAMVGRVPEFDKN